LNVELTEDHIIFRNSLRSFFENECPKSLVRKWEEEKMGFSYELWKKLCRMGCLGLTFPEKYGGTEADPIYLSLFYEEAGRALFPSPHLTTEVLAGTTILSFGSERHKNFILPEISKGNLIITASLLDFMLEQFTHNVYPQPATELMNLNLPFSYRQAMDGYVINGTKLFVPYGHVAHYFLFAADGDISGKQGEVIFFLIGANQKGISLKPLKTLAGTNQDEVKIRNLKLSEENVLGRTDGKTLKKIAHKGILAISSEMLGGAQAVLDMTVSYAKERIQFGRPIGSFQANAFKLADLSMAIEGARLLIHSAAWMMGKDMACDKEISGAKAFMSDTYSRVTRDCLQLFGGYGFSEEFDIQLYFRRAKELELYLGSGDLHREMVAQAMGL